jgi:hypothetical protein
MAKTRVQRKQALAIPDSFVPQFWDRIDGRFAIVREIRRRYDELKADTGANSAQKDLLVQRAVFISVQLETMECMAAESGKHDPGVYTQMTNCLLGLLRQLGLERKKKDAENLQSYLEDRE